MPTVNTKHSIIIKSYFTIHIIVHCYGIINRKLYGYIVYFWFAIFVDVWKGQCACLMFDYVTTKPLVFLLIYFSSKARNQ
jgi:hypothetical protein